MTKLSLRTLLIGVSTSCAAVGAACGPVVPAEGAAGTWTGTLSLESGAAIEGAGESPGVVIAVAPFEAARTAATLCAEARDIQLSLGTVEFEIPSSSVCPDGVERTVVQADFLTVGNLSLDFFRLEVPVGSIQGAASISVTNLGSQDGTGDGFRAEYRGAVTK